MMAMQTMSHNLRLNVGSIFSKGLEATLSCSSQKASFDSKEWIRIQKSDHDLYAMGAFKFLDVAKQVP
jgi:hypothetical protein